MQTADDRASAHAQPQSLAGKFSQGSDPYPLLVLPSSPSPYAGRRAALLNGSLPLSLPSRRGSSSSSSRLVILEQVQQPRYRLLALDAQGPGRHLGEGGGEAGGYQGL